MGNRFRRVVQILAEAALADSAFQVAMGGGNDAHIDVDGAVASYALEGPFLQHAQQFGLQARVQLADFVEKQGAAVGTLKAAGMLAHGAREGTLFMAEQLTFNQRR